METLTTKKGKEFALEALAERREKSAIEGQINNALLHAGSPMYFYCKTCGVLVGSLPENYVTPLPELCDECQALKDQGWLEE